MIRTLATIVGVVCVATVGTAFLALGVMWCRGQLTDEFVAAVGALLRGEDPDAVVAGDDDETIAPSAEDVVDRRVVRILSLESREREVDLLLGMLDERAGQLETQRAKFDERTRAFEERLAALLATETSEATSLAQAVLKAQTPADAVASLMSLDPEQALVLLRGLPDKSIARILQQFGRSNDEEEIERGRALFEALVRGEPRRSLLEETAANAGEPEADVAP